ncbi:MAG: hypothetical protein ACQEXE_21925 [Bacillota bacterium]|uniref:hypothetical protein n=1 Tax=Bacillales TaxID=1385 RepID=UPI00096F7D11|nr:hypothetical protein [Paenibacillus sp. FSL R5-0490]OMF61715.1 hypothetical protein BK139_05150 [Paenibacillus sp. FSL R5-0490]
MSIVIFRKRNKRALTQKQKIRFVDSGERAFIDREYVFDVFEKYGYKRSEDQLIKELNELFENRR